MIDRHYNFNYSSGTGENGYLIKIYNLSIRYYNRGIVLAKEGKYTEAVHSRFKERQYTGPEFTGSGIL